MRSVACGHLLIEETSHSEGGFPGVQGDFVGILAHLITVYLIFGVTGAL